MQTTRTEVNATGPIGSSQGFAQPLWLKAWGAPGSGITMAGTPSAPVASPTA